MNSPELKSILGAAIRYWEPRRLIYNLAMIIVLLIPFGLNGKFHQLIDSVTLTTLFILGFIANILYFCAYIPDLALRYSDLSESWQSRGRSIIFVAGLIFALVLTFTIALGMATSLY